VPPLAAVQAAEADRRIDADCIRSGTLRLPAFVCGSLVYPTFARTLVGCSGIF
jgi:hypothetical protein